MNSPVVPPNWLIVLCLFILFGTIYWFFRYIPKLRKEFLFKKIGLERHKIKIRNSFSSRFLCQIAFYAKKETPDESFFNDFVIFFKFLTSDVSGVLKVADNDLGEEKFFVSKKMRGILSVSYGSLKKYDIRDVSGAEWDFIQVSDNHCVFLRLRGLGQPHLVLEGVKDISASADNWLLENMPLFGALKKIK